MIARSENGRFVSVPDRLSLEDLLAAQCAIASLALLKTVAKYIGKSLDDITPDDLIRWVEDEWQTQERSARQLVTN